MIKLWLISEKRSILYVNSNWKILSINLGLKRSILMRCRKTWLFNKFISSLGKSPSREKLSGGGCVNCSCTIRVRTLTLLWVFKGTTKSSFTWTWDYFWSSLRTSNNQARGIILVRINKKIKFSSLKTWLFYLESTRRALNR